MALNLVFVFSYKIVKSCPQEHILSDGNCEEGEENTDIELEEEFMILMILGIISILLFLMLIIIQFANYTLLNVISKLKEIDKDNDPKNQATWIGILKVLIIIYIYI